MCVCKYILEVILWNILVFHHFVKMFYGFIGVLNICRVTSGSNPEAGLFIFLQSHFLFYHKEIYIYCYSFINIFLCPIIYRVMVMIISNDTCSENRIKSQFWLENQLVVLVLGRAVV